MPPSNRQPNVGFLVEYVAGWVTHYENIRKVAERDPGLNPRWHLIDYYRRGGRLETLRERWFRFVPGYVTGNLRFAHGFGMALKAAKYDAIVTNSRVGGMLHPAELATTPTIVELDCTPRQFDRMPAYGSPRDPSSIAYAKWRLHRRMYRSARVVQAWSNWARQGVIDEYGIEGDKVIVNPPGVDVGFWIPGPSDSDSPARPKKVLFVGADLERKGGHLLLEWFRHQAESNVELHLVTREPVKPAPGLFVYDDVRPNSPALRRLYQDADVFVLASRAECFGIATIEAMASGLPVIMSDVGGYADIVDHDGNGYVIRSGSVTDLSAAIAAVLDSDSRRRAMGLRSRQLAEARFDVEKNALRTLGIVKDLATGAAPTTRIPPAPAATASI